jgi:hypothetical protein
MRDTRANANHPSLVIISDNFQPPANTEWTQHLNRTRLIYSGTFNIFSKVSLSEFFL